MKEYTILKRYGNGCPFYSLTFKTLESAKQYIIDYTNEMELKNYKVKTYYVDNNFFHNKYTLGIPSQIYLQIHVREVTEWENIDTHNINKNIQKNKNTKILNFCI